MITQLARITLATPITIYLAPWGGEHPRVASGVAPVTYDAENGEAREIEYLDAAFTLNVITRTVHAQLAPIPRPLQIYGPDDFAVIAADTPEQHADRVLQLLGSDPAAVLQALINGEALPPAPVRVPREIPNWRAKVILAGMGLLPTVEAAIASLPEPDRTVATLAWGGDAKLARRGKTVLGLSAALGLSSDQIDELFIAAEALEV